MSRQTHKIIISKLDASASQLETAIKLFFEGRDILSAYTLCCAADGILEGLWETWRGRILQDRGIHPDYPPPDQQSWKEIMNDLLVPEHKKEAITLFNKTQNFLKHADKDPDEDHEFDQFNETSVKIMATCRNFSLVSGRLPPAIRAYMEWCAVAHPRLLKEECDLRKIIEKNAPREIPQEDTLAAGLILLKKRCPELFTENQSAIRGSPYTFKLPTL